MVQIVRANPSTATLRQQAFQEGLDQAASGFNTLYKDSETQRQMALKMLANKQGQGLMLSPQEEGFVQSEIQRAMPSSSILNTLGIGGEQEQAPIAQPQAQITEPALQAPQEFQGPDLSMYTPQKQAEIRSRLTEQQLKTKQLEELNKPFEQTREFQKLQATAGLRAQGKTPKAVKEPNLAQNQFAAGGFAVRAEQAVNDLAKLPENIGTTTSAQFQGMFPGAAESLKAPEQKLFEQTQRNFISAVLRKESGAAISDNEYDNERKKYFPLPGDTPEVLQQKAVSRQQAIASLKAEAGEAYNKVQAQLPQQAPADYVQQQKALRLQELRQKAGMR